MTLRDLLVISGLCSLTEDADKAIRLTLKKEIIHLFGEDAFERLGAIEASNEESEEVMLQILRSLAVDQDSPPPISAPVSAEPVAWHPVNGKTHGYEGSVVLRHKNGEYRIAHTNWLGDHTVQPYPPSKPKELAYVGTLDMGYEHWMPLEAPVAAQEQTITAADAVYGLLAWLSGRDEVVTLSARHGAAIAADLAKTFCEANGLQQFSQDYPDNLKYPKSALEQQPVSGAEDELHYKLSCFIDYATGGRLSKLNWPLAMLKQSHDENLEALIAERMQEAKEDEQDADKVDAEIDKAFEAVRKQLNKLPRYSFYVRSGGVNRAEDKTGNWIEWEKAHSLFDPVSVDAARKERT